MVALTATPAAIASAVRPHLVERLLRTAPVQQIAEDEDGDHHLQHVADRLRVVCGQRDVGGVVGQHAPGEPRPQLKATDVQERDGDADRQPHDGGDRAREPQREPELGRGVIRGGQARDTAEVAGIAGGAEQKRG